MTINLRGKKQKENKFCMPGSGILLTVLKIALVPHVGLHCRWYEEF